MCRCEYLQVYSTGSEFNTYISLHLGTGDILCDMDNQVKANSIRIHLLESQNEGLRNSIGKLQQMQYQQQPDYSTEGNCNNNNMWATHLQVTVGVKG